MTLTPQISYRNIPPSAAMSVAISDHAQRLATMCQRISHLRVSVEGVNLDHRKGAQYHVHIELGVPGKELVVSRNADENHANEDAYTAVRDAFRAMKRQLGDYVAMRQDFDRSRKERRWEGLGPQVLRGDEPT